MTDTKIISGLDKAKMTANFNAAVDSYDTVSALQKHVGDELLDRLSLIKITPEIVLDLGSGPGRLADKLAKRYPASRIVQLDIAEKMLGSSRNRRRKLFAKNSYVCADAELVPLATQSVDLIFSNLMLQWVSSPDQMLEGLSRILKPGTLFIFSSFGPDTLREFRESWNAVDDSTHVHTFLDMHDLGDALIRAGFSDPVIEVDYVTLTYNSVQDMMQDLKALGAVNVSADRRRALTGKNRFMRMQSEYENKRNAGRIPATYEVIYGHAWIPSGVESARQDEPGTFSISLDTLRHTLKKFT